MVDDLKKGFIFQQNGQLNKAKKIFQKILKKNIDNYEILNLLGATSIQLGEFKDAEFFIKKAIKINPNNSALYNNLGIVYQKLEKNSEAIENFKKALDFNNNHFGAYNNLGILYKKIFRFEEAKNNYLKAIEIKNDYYEAYNNLGLLNLSLRNMKDTFLNFNKAIDLNNNYIDAYKNRASAYELIKKFKLANDDYRKLISIDQKNKLYYQIAIFFNEMEVCKWDDFKKNNFELDKLINKKIHFFLPLKILYLKDNPSLIKRNINNFNQKYLNIKNNRENLNNLQKNKIRIGYFSPDFREHAVSYLIANVLENHNKNNFEIFGFHFNLFEDDEMTKRVLKAFSEFYNLKNSSNEEVILKSRSSQIDIAIDLSGHTNNSLSSIFAKGVAPIQINFLGFPGTVGNFMDYIIADRYLIPKKEEKNYFEKIIYMPNIYQPYDPVDKNLRKKQDKKKFNLPDSKFIYCCFNNCQKINPDIFKCWMRILKKTLDTVLCLLINDSDARINLINACKIENVDHDRLIFLKTLPYEDHLERFKHCDIFLDTHPYSGHTTASEALSQGLPLISLVGKSFQSRVSSSLLSNLRMKELITVNIENYEQLAVSLAKDKVKFKNIKNKLIYSIKKLDTFNTEKYTASLEKGYKEIYNLHCNKLLPKNIYLD
jgi:predicted O-linked N-acetylglucosamine transferase (SPINDLY family)